MSKNKTRTKDKYRVVYNDTQRIELENEFRLNEYIAIPRKQEIAHKLQLSERQIKIWFQNRRAKKRKQQKRRQSAVPTRCRSPASSRSPSSTSTPTNVATHLTSTHMQSPTMLPQQQQSQPAPSQIGAQNLYNQHEHQMLGHLPAAALLNMQQQVDSVATAAYQMQPQAYQGQQHQNPAPSSQQMYAQASTSPNGPNYAPPPNIQNSVPGRQQQQQQQQSASHHHQQQQQAAVMYSQQQYSQNMYWPSAGRPSSHHHHHHPTCHHQSPAAAYGQPPQTNGITHVSPASLAPPEQAAGAPVSSSHQGPISTPPDVQEPTTAAAAAVAAGYYSSPASNGLSVAAKTPYHHDHLHHHHHHHQRLHSHQMSEQLQQQHHHQTSQHQQQQHQSHLFHHQPSSYYQPHHFGASPTAASGLMTGIVPQTQQMPATGLAGQCARRQSVSVVSTTSSAASSGSGEHQSGSPLGGAEMSPLLMKRGQTESDLAIQQNEQMGQALKKDSQKFYLFNGLTPKRALRSFI